MINILQNVTKDNVLLQLKRIAVGAIVLVPVALIVGCIVYLISNGYINANTAFTVFQVFTCLFILWTIGGAYESYKAMKDFERYQEERKTQRAFEKLSNGNT